jgi:hypothetical protein
MVTELYYQLILKPGHDILFSNSPARATVLSSQKSGERGTLEGLTVRFTLWNGREERLGLGYITTIAHVARRQVLNSVISATPRPTAQPARKAWIQPAIEIVEVGEARGGDLGTNTDKFGSLSCVPSKGCYTH